MQPKHQNGKNHRWPKRILLAAPVSLNSCDQYPNTSSVQSAAVMLKYGVTRKKPIATNVEQRFPEMFNPA